MIHPIRNFLALASVSWPFIKVYRSQFTFRKKKGSIYHFWQNTLQEIPDLKTIEGPLQRRIAHYLHANAITTQWFSILHHKVITQTERAAGYYLAIATPIADYLVDKESLTLEHVQGLLKGSYAHPFDRIAQELYRLAKLNNANRDHFDAYLHATLLAQARSQRQNSAMISSADLRSITWNKGGYALLLYRSALDVPISNSEEEAVYQLGGLMQLHNDIFDLFRDIQEKITTIPSSTAHIFQLRQLFEEEIEKTIQYFRSLPLGEKALLRFLLLLHLAVGTGFICLQQYALLEEKYGRFDPASLSRDELICDMDHFGKIYMNLRQTLLRKYDE